MALNLEATPPPARATSPRKNAAEKRQDKRTSEREEAVNGLFQLGAAGCLMAHQVADGAAIAEHGPNIAHETALLAENNASFAKVIDYITAIGPYAGLLTACLPLILQVAVNHKRLPAEPLAQFGVVSPETLTAKLAAQAAVNQARMMEEAREAEREANEAMARLAENDAA